MAARSAALTESKSSYRAIKEEEIPQVKLDLSRLTRFNPAIIYLFTATTLSDDSLFDMIGQQEDLFNAYLYAQDTILPALEASWDNLTPANILCWINELHARLAKSLADYVGYPGNGVYVDEPVFRWKESCDEKAYFYGALNFLYDKALTPAKLREIVQIVKITAPAAPQDFIIKNYKTDCLNKAVDYVFKNIKGHSKQDIAAFLEVLLAVHENNTIELPDSFLPTDSHSREAVMAFHKLYVAYNQNKLSASQKVAVEKFVKIPAMPETMKLEMKKFADELCGRWRECKPADIKSTASIMSFAFVKSTFIHPFFDGNGRVATCLINTIAVSLRCPSIVLRPPDEKSPEAKAYNAAIDVIDDDPLPLTRFIEAQLKAASIKLIEHTDLRRGLEQRVPFTNWLLRESHKNLHIKLPAYCKFCFWQPAEKELFEARTHAASPLARGGA